MLSTAFNLVKNCLPSVYPLYKATAIIGINLPVDLLLPYAGSPKEGESEKVEKIFSEFSDSLHKEMIQSGIQLPIKILNIKHQQIFFAVRTFKNAGIGFSMDLLVDISTTSSTLKHEICHLINNDMITESILRATTTCVAALSVRYLGFSFLPSTICPIFVDMITAYYIKNRAENRADDFCIEHATVDELKGQIRLITAMKNVWHRALFFMNWMPNPLNHREKKFQAALNKNGVSKYVPTKEELEPLENVIVNILTNKT